MAPQRPLAWAPVRCLTCKGVIGEVPAAPAMVGPVSRLRCKRGCVRGNRMHVVWAVVRADGSCGYEVTRVDG